MERVILETGLPTLDIVGQVGGICERRSGEGRKKDRFKAAFKGVFDLQGDKGDEGG